jgi:hypothetical protein
VRGGGLYACGFAVTFAVLEVRSFFDDVRQIGLLFDGQVISFVVNFFVDSFMNTVSAFAWPATVVQISPPWGAVGLGLAFIAFPIYIKKHIETWLFSGEDREKPAEPLEDK